MRNFFDLFSRRRRCKPLTEAQNEAVSKYRHFRNVLNHNHAGLKAIADLEQLYHSGKPFSLTGVRIRYEELLEAVGGVIFSLEALSGRDYPDLSRIASEIDRELFETFNPKCEIPLRQLVLPLEEVTPEMKAIVGGKAAHLATVQNGLGLPVPPGFSITTYAFERFLEENRLWKPIRAELSRIASDSPEDMDRAGRSLREMILRSPVPGSLAREIMAAYATIEARTQPGVRMALRSSAVGEDSEATFAGQYETVLNVTRDGILDAYRRVLASKYSPRAISYRIQCGLDERQTPMGVLAVVMIDAAASGVLYSVDPSSVHLKAKGSCSVRINSLWGLGENLVDGSVSPDVFVVDRISRSVLERHVAAKEVRLVNRETGGTVSEAVPDSLRFTPSLDDESIRVLTEYGLSLEEYFEAPQDVEWALDGQGRMVILQSRPLQLPEEPGTQHRAREFPGNPVLLKGGTTASTGIAVGEVFLLRKEADLGRIPQGAVVVARTASPDLATVAGRIRGLITDVGSVTSHMSSVAREFGIPAIVDAAGATERLKSGDIVTLAADWVTVYRGVVGELADEMTAPRRPIFNSPLHQRLRYVLDRISPLNLLDRTAPEFAAESCRSFQDVIRFTHETAVREMFGLSGEGHQGVSVKIQSPLPLNFWLVDLGGGLREGLTTCDEVTPEMVESVPMRALWQGFSHPGVSWEGTMSLNRNKLSGMLAVSATSELGEVSGGDSYGLLSHDYANLSVRFAYHFATIDALCGENSSQNYVSLQFSGGAGSYLGRSLRIDLLGRVLERLGFSVSLKGDLIEAYLGRCDRHLTEEKLDILGRLLASSRLVDMRLASEEDVRVCAEAFIDGKYDFLTRSREDEINGFYTQGGPWRRVEEEGRVLCLEDGSRWGRSIASGVSGLVGKVVGTAYHEFLDSLQAYYYFPLAIVKDRDLTDGAVSVMIKPVRGSIDRAGGIVFAMKNVNNYFVLRSNALEDNVVLFEFINGKRLQRKVVSRRIGTGLWHELRVEVSGPAMRGFYNGERVVEHVNEHPLSGSFGLWTKADSVTCFDALTFEAGGRRETIPF